MNIFEMINQTTGLIDELHNIESTGTDPDNAVVVTIDGTSNLKALKINFTVNPGDEQVLANLIVSAFNNAKENLANKMNGSFADNAMTVSDNLVQGLFGNNQNTNED